jgi:hypothetical protein
MRPLLNDCAFPIFPYSRLQDGFTLGASRQFARERRNKPFAGPPMSIFLNVSAKVSLLPIHLNLFGHCEASRRIISELGDWRAGWFDGINGLSDWWNKTDIQTRLKERIDYSKREMS